MEDAVKWRLSAQGFAAGHLGNCRIIMYRNDDFPNNRWNMNLSAACSEHFLTSYQSAMACFQSDLWYGALVKLSDSTIIDAIIVLPYLIKVVQIKTTI